MTVFFCAGEASGDRLAAGLVHALAAIHPDWHLTGIGSRRMQAAGMELLLDITHTSAVGISEALLKLVPALTAIRRAKRLLRRLRPEIFVAVDCQGINLILAKTARACGGSVIYYIPPQNYLWNDVRRGREIVRRSDLMINLFRAGHDFYSRLGARSVLSGHPLAGHADTRDKIAPDTAGPEILLAAGVRSSERRRFIPLLAAAARRILEVHPAARFTTPAANPGHAAFLQAGFAREGIQIAPGESGPLFRRADAAIVKSGTMALEAALAGCPYSVFYRISRFSWFIMARVWGVSKKLTHVSLPNILAGKELAREFLQGAATPRALADETLSLLDDPDYRKTRLDLIAGALPSPAGDSAWNIAARAVSRFVDEHTTIAPSPVSDRPETVPQKPTEPDALRIPVVCGVLTTDDGLIYAFQRGPGVSHAGRWEFPGGRIETGESAEEALKRELQEELQCSPEIDEALPVVDSETIRLVPFRCRMLPGEVFKLGEHSAVRLDSGEALSSLDWLPADREILRHIIRTDSSRADHRI